jgi:hypothetical protein
VLTCGVLIGGGLASLAGGVPKPLRYKEAGGWRELARHVAAAQAELAAETGQQPFVLGVDKFALAALIGFYTAQPQHCVNAFATGAPGIGYRFWTDLGRFEGRPAIVVVPDLRPLTLDAVRGHFGRVEAYRPLTLLAHGEPVRTVFLAKGFGYRGGHLNVAFPKNRGKADAQ